MTDGEHKDEPHLPAADRLLSVAEDVIYLGACAVLVVGALLLLGKAGYDLATGLDEGVSGTATSVLDTLLLVFILVELLSAVRQTIAERQLVAEPFLLVGLIATIKEIVVTGTTAKDLAGTEEFEDAILEIGVLGGLLLILGIALWLLRLKEREPEEGSRP